jgi:hypothetical protein
MSEKAQEIIDYIVREVIVVQKLRSLKTLPSFVRLIDSLALVNIFFKTQGRYPHEDSYRKGSTKRPGYHETDVRNRATGRQTA